MYDKNNVFFKILQKQIPANIVYEDDVCLAFHDINPTAKVHVLIITKGCYINLTDFVKNESAENVQKFFQAVAHIAEKLKISESGYRILSNIGHDAGQEIDHFHVHIIGGEKLQ